MGRLRMWDGVRRWPLNSRAATRSRGSLSAILNDDVIRSTAHYYYYLCVVYENVCTNLQRSPKNYKNYYFCCQLCTCWCIGRRTMMNDSGSMHRTDTCNVNWTRSPLRRKVAKTEPVVTNVNCELDPYEQFFLSNMKENKLAIIFDKNAFENTVCKMTAILFRYQCLNETRFWVHNTHLRNIHIVWEMHKMPSIGVQIQSRHSVFIAWVGFYRPPLFHLNETSWDLYSVRKPIRETRPNRLAYLLLRLVSRGQYGRISWTLAWFRLLQNR